MNSFISVRQKYAATKRYRKGEGLPLRRWLEKQLRCDMPWYEEVPPFRPHPNEDDVRFDVNWEPRPLGPRKRALSIISCASNGRTGAAYQAQSSLLARLPLELRLLIYQMVLGGRIMVIFKHEDKGIRHSCCWRTPQDRPDWCLEIVSACGWDEDCAARHEAEGCTKVSLLQTCKQIYSEAVDIMYSHNRFDFTYGLINFIQFSKTTLPQRLQAMTRLDLKYDRWSNCTNAQDPQSWTEECVAVLQTMIRLKELTFDFDTLNEEWRSPKAEIGYLRTLSVLKPSSVFEVKLSWEKPDVPVAEAEEEEDYPFKLFRPPWPYQFRRREGGGRVGHRAQVC